MPHRSEFYLYRRKKTRGTYWYVCFVDPRTGRQETAKSIDVLKEKLGMMDLRSVRRRDEAAVIAHKALERGILGGKTDRVCFADYCLSFWDYDNSMYIKRRNSMKEGSIGREYANNMYFFLKRDVLPLLPVKLPISEVRTRDLDGIVDHLLVERKLSSGTVQLVTLSFSIPLKEAYREGLISSNPVERMVKVVRTERERGAFSMDECIRIMNALDEAKERLYPSYYLAMILALVTGMRSGEVRALNEKDISSSSFPGLSLITVRHSISPYSGLKCTKGKYDRNVLIPTELADALVANKDGNGLLLPSIYGGYMSSPTLREQFYRIMEKAGIDRDERERRNLTFHSLRHTFSTLGRDMDISQEDRMLVLGHRSREVNDRYTHSSSEALRRVSELTRFLFSNIGSADEGAEISR